MLVLFQHMKQLLFALKILQLPLQPAVVMLSISTSFHHVFKIKRQKKISLHQTTSMSLNSTYFQFIFHQSNATGSGCFLIKFHSQFAMNFYIFIQHNLLRIRLDSIFSTSVFLEHSRVSPYRHYAFYLASQLHLTQIFRHVICLT